MRSVIILMFLASALFISCSKDDFLPDLEGNMVGYVYTFDEFTELLPDHRGVLVTTRGKKRYKTITDKDGRFEFKDLPTGTYELTIEKPGFGTLKCFDVKHLGGTPTIIGLTDEKNTIRAFFIYRIPVTKILELSIENDTIYASFDLKNLEPYWMVLWIYFSEKPGFSTDEALQSIRRGLQAENGQYKCNLTQYNTPNLPKGKMIFFKARICNSIGGLDIGNMNVHGISNYFDYSLNKTVYPNVGNESSQYSFIVPE
jgi:hypothetical protein